MLARPGATVIEAAFRWGAEFALGLADFKLSLNFIHFASVFRFEFYTNPLIFYFDFYTLSIACALKRFVGA